ncbi:MAG: hypothetical protein NTX03_02360, partial [Bacteroidetes bacterium]|nr:hypothetical protein [Bacteroidota bacterium]
MSEISTSTEGIEKKYQNLRCLFARIMQYNQYLRKQNHHLSSMLENISGFANEKIQSVDSSAKPDDVLGRLDDYLSKHYDSGSSLYDSLNFFDDSLWLLADSSCGWGDSSCHQIDNLSGFFEYLKKQTQLKAENPIASTSVMAANKRNSFIGQMMGLCIATHKNRNMKGTNLRTGLNLYLRMYDGNNFNLGSIKNIGEIIGKSTPTVSRL